MRGGTDAGAGLGLVIGCEPSSGIFSAGRGGSSDSKGAGTGAGKTTGCAGCTTTVGVSTGRGGAITTG